MTKTFSQHIVKFHDVMSWLFEKKRIFQKELESEKLEKNEWSSKYRNARNGIAICQNMMDEFYGRFNPIDEGDKE